MRKDIATVPEYDYIGVPYPEGNIGSSVQFLFNNEDVVDVVHRGFTDDEWTEFIKKLSDFYAQPPTQTP